MTYYDNRREHAGRKAELTEEVFFYTSTSRNDASKRTFPKGAIVTLKYYQGISDLYIFSFKTRGGTFEFPIRDTKFKWVN
jgi:hypothetical protein